MRWGRLSGPDAGNALVGMQLHWVIRHWRRVASGSRFGWKQHLLDRLEGCRVQCMLGLECAVQLYLDHGCTRAWVGLVAMAREFHVMLRCSSWKSCVMDPMLILGVLLSVHVSAGLAQWSHGDPRQP